MGRRLIAVLVAASLVGGAIVAEGAPASAAPAKWSVAPSSYRGTLSGVSCVSVTHCVAVGRIEVGAPFDDHASRSLIEVSDGTTWSRIPSPNVRDGVVLNGVSCATRSRCVAVGSFKFGPRWSRSLIEMFDGKQWSITRNPNEGNADGILYGVSCPRITFCVAVGDANPSADGSSAGSIIKTWDGIRWSLTPSPDLAIVGGTTTLYGVSCASATFCVAVGWMNFLGTRAQSLVETWDGARWSITPTPRSTAGQVLYGVSCASASFCAAVGSSSRSTLVEIWNGEAWVETPSPDYPERAGNFRSNTLTGVSCVSSASCTAVGQARADGSDAVRPVIEKWNGTRWTFVHSPRAASQPRNRSLAGISCPSSTRCAAVGTYASGSAHPESLIVVGATPPRSVTVSWTTAESVRLIRIAAFLHQSTAATLKTAVYALAYVIGLGPHAVTPLTLPPPGAAATQTAVWDESELAVIDSVGAKYALTSAGAARVSLHFLSYILALGGH